MDKTPRVLLVKPYEDTNSFNSTQPPLGILYLISTVRRRFGDRVEIGYHDLRLSLEKPEKFAARVSGRYDLIGISAVNHEADATHRLARALRELSPETIVVLGGPYGRSAPDRAMAAGGIDWIFRGESDLTFPRAIDEWFFGDRDLGSIPGLIWRRDRRGPFVENPGEDSIDDINALPLPAWDVVPFDLYARGFNMNGSLRAKRYAPLFTSRGCPYKCNYCHDIFGKTYRWRSVDSVMAEIELLTDKYGVREFQIVDDIYNLHKPRMREIARRVIARYGRRKLTFTFPNGVRADIIDPADLPLLRDMGVYDMSIAIETVSPRLQKLIEKNLNVEHARRVIDAAADAGITTKGFFMLGFPTETLEEIERTIQFAVGSRLTMAHFFCVVPQQGTPIYDLALRESPDAVKKIAITDYHSRTPWYQVAYGVDMQKIRRSALIRFYFRPSQFLPIARRASLLHLIRGGFMLTKMILSPGTARKDKQPALPMSMLEEAPEPRAEAAVR